MEDRVTQLVLMVEYEPLPILFDTQTVLMVEYSNDDFTVTTRIYGPATQ